jgi:DNA helicase-2/ATP-dependent DNA helicase PcrA
MISALDIANELGIFPPTEAQRDIIEAPPTGIYRVIAGAGSGKTETMAQRVLWLVANGHVQPQHVLGLTFTRKAAGELGHRMGTRLAELQARGLAQGVDEFERPLVSTYNSFAGSLYREHAILLGRDPDATVLSEASAWALARRVVTSSTLPALAEWDYSANELTRVVRVLAQRCAENSVEREDIEKFCESFHQLAELPAGGTGQYADVDKWVQTVDSLVPLLDLVSEYAEAKRVRGLIEFSDQVALALELVKRHPDIAREITLQHQVVLLDEYQDTSVAQTQLLAGLFSGHPVMAVGDPHQAIYGWRGASSSNLVEFADTFGKDVVQTFTLATSWRNGVQVLACANQLATPLRELPGLDVGVLDPAPSASQEPVDIIFEETLEEEAARVAQWCQEQLALTPAKPPSAAILVRARQHQRVFVEALQERGVPVHVLGIGGLLDDPAIADVVCALRVVASPHAETELVRLLAGARWRVGVSDLHALAGTARWLQGRDASGHKLSTEVANRLKSSVAPSDHAGLLDALSFIATVPESHHQIQNYSPEGYQRLIDAHQVLTQVNSLRLVDVDELVPAIERALNIDIEVLANPYRRRSLAAREAFMDALHSYLAISEDSGVVGFVQWLAEAERRDNLTPRVEPAEPGCVQVLTIHGAKGLEWDLVVIPRLVEGELPSTPREVQGWLNRGELPYPFRGDSASLPHFGWRQAGTKKEAIAVHKEFTDEVRAHRLTEERRLGYVALTRAKHRLLLTGSFWAHQQKPRGPSTFLRELEEAGLVGPLPVAPVSDTPAERHVPSSRVWPGDPLGSRRPFVQRAADMVTDALTDLPAEPADPDVRRLAELRARAAETPLESVLALRTRIPASSLEYLAHNREELTAQLARPLPRKPLQAALLGTLFHQYVEDRYGSTVAGPLLEFDGAADEEESAITSELSIEEWKARFDRSEFANQTPIAIEAELHLPLAGHLVICKIDAVFPDGDGVHIVDWKTGKAPADDEQLQRKSLQLAAYRLAWSEWARVPLEKVRASFWFVDTETLVTPAHLAGRDQLHELLVQADKP